MTMSESANTQAELSNDGILSDEVLEALKKAADSSCLLCELEDLGEED
jgi:hypothetical protein